MSEMKPISEGLYSTNDDGPIGPHHRKVTAIIDNVLNVAVHVELECGHTVVIINPEWAAQRGGLVFCGECAERAK